MWLYLKLMMVFNVLIFHIPKPLLQTVVVYNVYYKHYNVLYVLYNQIAIGHEVVSIAIKFLAIMKPFYEWFWSTKGLTCDGHWFSLYHSWLFGWWV